MATKMRTATWTSVQAMGIPPSSTRDVLFHLADLIDSRTSGEDLALLSGAFRAVMNVLKEHHKPQSALEIQLDTIRVQRELFEATGVELPPVAFTHSDFDLPPETPTELGRQLGYDDGGRAVRAVLRRGFPDHPKHSRWDPLSTAQINYVKAHLGSRL